MSRFGSNLGIVWGLLISLHVMGQQEDTSTPEIWREIQTAVRGTLKDVRDIDDPVALRKDLAARAATIAKRYDRSAIEVLLRSADRARKTMHDTTQARLAAQLSGLLIAELADPNDTNGFKSALSRQYLSFGLQWDSVAIAAMDLFHDGSSKQSLLELALADSTTDTKKKLGRFEYDPPDRSRLAWQLLRAYEPDQLREKLEAKLLTPEIAAEKPSEQYQTYSADLRAVIASLDFAQQLKDPAERARFRNFESRLWRARAIGPKYFRGADTQYDEAAKIFDKQWQSGDEQFLLRIFEEPATTPDEVLIAVRLPHRLTKQGVARLQKVAASQSPHAAKAQELLDRAASNR